MPIFPILTGHWLKKRYHAKKLIFEIRDIWPLTLIELGETSKFHPITQFIGWFENFGYRKSDSIVTLLPYAAKHIVAHGGSEEKISYIPNGLDEEVLKKEPLSCEVKNKLPTGKFIIGYTGTHNLGNALEYLVEAAKKMSVIDKDVFFVLVGDGYKRDDLIRMASGLDNILFISKIPKQQIQDMLKHFNICFVGRNNSHLFDFGISGNKYFDYMMAARPILDSNNSKGGPAELADCGLRVEAESADAIVKGILQLKNMTEEERSEIGQRGRAFLKKYHSMKYLADKYSLLFQ
jgi:glycosyltransferase involved in cell wall biosynthesis